MNIRIMICGYRFASPESIRFPILEARLDCSWIEEPLYLDKAHFSRLEEILKSAKLTGVGNCGYGAKLTLTLENGETVVIFKGTDDCGSLVFGSWGGYSISDKADDEFWKMFGLNPNEDKRLISQDEYGTETEEEQEEYTENSGVNTKNPVEATTMVDTSKISGIVMTNGNTGEQITLTAEASLRLMEYLEGVWK